MTFNGRKVIGDMRNMHKHEYGDHQPMRPDGTYTECGTCYHRRLFIGGYKG